MQSMTRCKHYTTNANPNKTCQNRKRCQLFSDTGKCYSYLTKDANKGI